MQVEYLQSKKLSISDNCLNNVPTNTLSQNYQHFVLQTHFGRMYLRRQQLQALKRVHKYLQVRETLVVSYVGYSESKYRLRISLVHPRDCPFAHVQ